MHLYFEKEYRRKYDLNFSLIFRLNDELLLYIYLINGHTHSSLIVSIFQVIQVFFPFSLQLYPNKFPGEDPKDCPRNMKKEEYVL